MPPKKTKLTPPKPLRVAAIAELLQNYVLGEGKVKLNAAQIRIALELLKLREAQKKRASDSRARRLLRNADVGVKSLEAQLRDLE